VKGWLTYCGAFALAIGAAMICYLAAFTMLMSSYGYGIGGFILLAVICPAVAGLVTFGVSYAAFSQHPFGLQGWLNALALVVVATALGFGLIVSGVLEESVAALALLAILFTGGRVMITRRTDA
jgi:hypothetical protein